MSELNDDVKALAKILSPGVKVGKDGICEVDADLYEKTLDGTTLTLDNEIKAQKHKTTVAAALAYVVGEKSIKAMEKDNDLNTVDAEMMVGKDKLGVIIERSRNEPDMHDTNDGKVKTVYGGVNVKYTVMGASTSRGQVKVVKDILRQRATEAFGE